MLPDSISLQEDCSSSLEMLSQKVDQTLEVGLERQANCGEDK